MKKKLGLRARIILVASAFMLATNLALGAALMQQSRRAMKTLIDERMLDVVNTAAAMLDGDVLDRLRAEALQMLELRHLKQEPYNLVLMDWKMPGQDGLETARLIRDRYSSETTVIILTAYVDALTDTYNRQYLNHILSAWISRGSSFAGDEFIVLKRTRSADGLKPYMDEVLRRLADYNAGERLYPLSLSYGMSFFETGDMDTFMKEMDDNMYRMKAGHHAREANPE